MRRYSPIAMAAGFTALTLSPLLASCGGSFQQGVTATSVDINAVVCVINTYSTEVQNGVNPVQAGIDAASKCNLATAVASTILAAHTAGLEREGAPPVDGGGEQLDHE